MYYILAKIFLNMKVSSVLLACMIKKLLIIHRMNLIHTNYIKLHVMSFGFTHYSVIFFRTCKYCDSVHGIRYHLVTMKFWPEL